MNSQLLNDRICPVTLFLVSMSVALCLGCSPNPAADVPPPLVLTAFPVGDYATSNPATAADYPPPPRSQVPDIAGLPAANRIERIDLPDWSVHRHYQTGDGGYFAVKRKGTSLYFSRIIDYSLIAASGGATPDGQLYWIYSSAAPVFPKFCWKVDTAGFTAARLSIDDWFDASSRLLLSHKTWSVDAFRSKGPKPRLSIGSTRGDTPVTVNAITTDAAPTTIRRAYSIAENPVNSVEAIVGFSATSDSGVEDLYVDFVAWDGLRYKSLSVFRLLGSAGIRDLASSLTSNMCFVPGGDFFVIHRHQHVWVVPAPDNPFPQSRPYIDTKYKPYPLDAILHQQYPDWHPKCIKPLAQIKRDSGEKLTQFMEQLAAGQRAKEEAARRSPPPVRSLFSESAPGAPSNQFRGPPATPPPAAAQPKP